MGEILPLVGRVTVSVTYKSEVISLPLLIVQGKGAIFWPELAQTHVWTGSLYRQLAYV